MPGLIGLVAGVLVAALPMSQLQRWAQAAPIQDWGFQRPLPPRFIRYAVAWPAGWLVWVMSGRVLLWALGGMEDSHRPVIVVYAAIASLVSLAVVDGWEKRIERDMSLGTLVGLHLILGCALGFGLLIVLAAIGLGNIR